MNLRNITMTLGALLLIASQSISAEPVTIGDVEMGNDSKSKAFEQVKKKLGKWEGTMTQGLTGALFDVSYEFKLTSGGNTITETLVEDGVEILDTGGGILNMIKKSSEEDFLILNPDTIWSDEYVRCINCLLYTSPSPRDS